MEDALIAALLEKYWQAETTVEEERQLAEYFRQEEVPAEWESYREIFGFFEAEARVGVSEGFDRRILERIAEEGPGTAPVRILQRRAPWWAAAAVILLSLGGALWFTPRESQGNETAAREGIAYPVSGQPGGKAAQLSAATEIKDSYDDPQEALAAIRKALFKVSANMNKGKNITAKEMHHFNTIHYAINY